MPKKKAFLLRIEEKLYKTLEKWAEEDYRSVNSQIEYLLARAVEGKKDAAPRPPGSASRNPATTIQPGAPSQAANQPDDLDLSID